VGGVQASGVGWPEKYKTVEECARRCEQVENCRAFHYYGDKDKVYQDCYLQSAGKVGPWLDDGRDRYAGVCSSSSDIQRGWQKVFSHNTAGGFFANLDETKKKNIDDEEALLFSTLYNLESLRNNDGAFHFKLCYPELPGDFPCNEWIQTSNPVTETTVTGYKAVKITWNRNGINGPFQGLGLSPTSFKDNLIDAAPTHSRWWFSIGTIRPHVGGIPGPRDGRNDDGKVVKKNELYVMTDK